MTSTRFCRTCGDYRPVPHDHPPSLFDEGYSLYDGTPPHEAVSTSSAAAVSIVPDVGRLQGVVLERIRESRAGMTDDDLERSTGLKHQTVSARRRELYLLGLIRSTGTRPTRSGRQAKVWVIR